MVVPSLFACPVTIYHIHDAAELPFDRFDDRSRGPQPFASDQLRPPAQMSRYPSHPDETCAKLGVGAARNVRAKKQYMSREDAQYFVAAISSRSRQRSARAEVSAVTPRLTSF